MSSHAEHSPLFRPVDKCSDKRPRRSDVMKISGTTCPMRKDGGCSKEPIGYMKCEQHCYTLYKYKSL